MTRGQAIKATLFTAAALAIAGTALPASGGEPSPPEHLKIQGAWVRAMPPGSDATAAYMTLINDGDTPLRLTGANTPVAKSASPMITTKKEVSGTEVLGMQGVDALVIPPHGRCELKPGGNHLMIMGLLDHPKPGEKIKLTLRFDPGGKEITLYAPVR